MPVCISLGKILLAKIKKQLCNKLLVVVANIRKMEIVTHSESDLVNEQAAKTSKKKLVLASCGLLKNVSSRRIKLICPKEGTTEELVTEIAEYIKDVKSPVVVIQVGGKETTSKGIGIDQGLFDRGHGTKKLQNMVVKDVLKPLKKLNSVVKQHKGVLRVTSLIPYPKDQDYEKSDHSEELQRYLSEIYVKINDEIDKFNKENRTHTPRIRHYLENTKRRYKQRQQQKILTKHFKGDMRTPEDGIIEKITKACEEELLDKSKNQRIQSSITH